MTRSTALTRDSNMHQEIGSFFLCFVTVFEFGVAGGSAIP